jgi:hypothetical protein
MPALSASSAKAFLFPPEPAEATGRAKPAGPGVSATAETAGKPGDLEAEEKDAADIMGGNADR